MKRRFNPETGQPETLPPDTPLPPLPPQRVPTPGPERSSRHRHGGILLLTGLFAVCGALAATSRHRR